MTFETQEHPVIEALRARQSMGRVKPDRVPKDIVERVIEAAGWAPNHYRTEPWRFYVLAGRAREDLGDVFAQVAAARLGNANPEEVRKQLETERAKPLRAPVVIIVAVVPSGSAKVVEIEEIAGSSAAVQNMLLAAEALGLGAMWRTGAPAYDPAIKRFLGIPEHGHVLAFVYIGYPDPTPRQDRVRNALRHTTWLGWNDQAETRQGG